MPEEAKTVSGTVGKIVEWRTGKGYFLNLKGDSNDYYGFGKCPAALEEECTFEVKEGTGSFEDKVQIAKKAKPQQKKQEAPEKAQETAQIAGEEVPTAAKVYYDRQDLIARESAVKSAAEVISHVVERSKAPPFGALADAVIDMADKLYLYITEQEKPAEPEEEPADEPEEGE